MPYHKVTQAEIDAASKQAATLYKQTAFQEPLTQAALENFKPSQRPRYEELVSKESMLNKPFCFHSARESSLNKYGNRTWSITVYQDGIPVYFELPASENRNELLYSMIASCDDSGGNIHMCTLKQVDFTDPRTGEDRTYFKFAPYEGAKVTVCPCGCIDGAVYLKEYSFKAFIDTLPKQDYTHTKVDAKDLVNTDFCITDLKLKTKAQPDMYGSQQFWMIKVVTSTGALQVFFLNNSPARERDFHIMDMPVHHCTIEAKTFTPKGEREERVYYAIVDSTASFCYHGKANKEVTDLGDLDEHPF